MDHGSPTVQVSPKRLSRAREDTRTFEIGRPPRKWKVIHRGELKSPRITSATLASTSRDRSFMDSCRVSRVPRNFSFISYGKPASSTSQRDRKTCTSRADRFRALIFHGKAPSRSNSDVPRRETRTVSSSVVCLLFYR